MAVKHSFFPNVMHSDKWKIMFSNIPVLDDPSQMKYFDNYVKSCTIPNYAIGEILSQLPNGFQVRHPLGGMKRNQDLGSLGLTFKVSEDMFNYLVLFTWIQQLRYGAINPNHKEAFRKYNIKRIVISMLDNEKRTVAEITFTNAFLSDISQLDLNFGTTEELSFACTFNYEEIFYSIKNPMVGGIVLEAPVNITECGTSGVPINPNLDWEQPTV
jgi:hypothetical protein